MGILPPDPVTLFRRRWVAGVGGGTGMGGYGLFSLLTHHSYLPWHSRFHSGFVEVFGVQASWTGISWLGAGIALFFHCFAEESELLAPYQEYGVAVGACAMAAGVVVASFGMLFGYF